MISQLLRTILLVTVLSFISCAGQPTTMITSTSPLPPNVRGTIPTDGNDCQYLLFGFIPISSSPNTQRALAEAKADVNVDVLTDVTVDHNYGYYILFGNHCVEVRGLGVPKG